MAQHSQDVRTPVSGRVLALDFDGVLHTHPYNGGVMPGQPHPGAQDFVHSMVRSGWSVIVHSARSDSAASRSVIQRWLQIHGFPALYVTNRKPQGTAVYLDDRAMRFNGTWPTPTQVDSYATPWHQQ